jgi:molecular chaperone GrpE
MPVAISKRQEGSPVNEQDKNIHPNSSLEDDHTDESGGSDLEQALAAKADEVKNLNDRYLRLAAEFENYKRLSQRDQREQAKFANETLLKDLLPIVDNLQRAVDFSQSSAGLDQLLQGVQLTLKQFLETLSKFGVRQVSSIGEPFDPTRHQAVAKTESDNQPENTIIQEHQPGYLLHDRIVRPAMVTVAAAPREEGEHHG